MSPGLNATSPLSSIRRGARFISGVTVSGGEATIQSEFVASLFGAVLAQLPALQTRLVAFDTAVTDLTPLLHDPVDVLFGA